MTNEQKLRETSDDEGTPLTDEMELWVQSQPIDAEARVGDAFNFARYLERTLHAKERELADERAIVDRIWDQLGRPSYEALNGRSIYDLIDELKVKAQSVSAAPPSGYVQVPEGWKLVPVEPTEEMLKAAKAGPHGYSSYQVFSIWGWMLAATPTPSDTKPGEGTC